MGTNYFLQIKDNSIIEVDYQLLNDGIEEKSDLHVKHKGQSQKTS